LNGQTSPLANKPALIINLGWEQSRLIEVLGEMDIPLVGIHGDENWSQTVEFDHVEIIDPRDLEKIIDLAGRIDPRCVIADQCDYSLFAAAMVGEHLCLPGPGVAQAQLGQNKFLSRESARKSGLKIPNYILCRSQDDALLAAREIGFPVVVKPIDNRGSFGVNVVKSEAQLAEAVREAIIHSHSRLFLVEQFIEGTNLIAEGYIFHDSGFQTLAVGSKTVVEGSPHIHKQVLFPAQIQPSTYEKVVDLNKQSAEAMGFRFGMTTAEYIVDSNEDVWLVEMGNRGGGVLISSHITPLVSGVDHTRQLVFDSLSIRRDLYEERSKQVKAVCLSYIILEPGELKSISGTEVTDAPGLVALRYWGPREGIIRSPRNALERQGMIIAEGNTVSEARRAAEDIEASLSVVY